MGVPAKLEHPDKPKHPQYTEDPQIDRDKCRDIERQECEEIDDSIRRYHVPEAAGNRGGIRRIEGTDPDPEEVLNSKDRDRDYVDYTKWGKVACTERFDGLQDDRQHVDDDEHRHEEIEIPGGPVSFR